MKKLLTTVIICCLLLCACASKTADLYTCYVHDIAMDGTLTRAAIETDWWDGSLTENPSSPETMTLTFNGKTYEQMQYRWTTMGSNDWYTRDSYRNDQARITIIPEEENKIVAYQAYNRKETATLPDIEEPYRTAVDFANEFVSQYIVLSDYVFSDDGSSTVEYEVDGETYELTTYSFYFTKYHDGIPTSDRIWMKVTSKGTLDLFSLGNIDAFDDLPEGIVDMEKVENTIETKLDLLYREKYGSYSYKVNDHTLTYSPEGDLVIMSKLTVTLSNGCDSGVVLATVIQENAIAVS